MRPGIYRASGLYLLGRMFWFTWNVLSGSYRCFSRANLTGDRALTNRSQTEGAALLL